MKIRVRLKDKEREYTEEAFNTLITKHKFPASVEFYDVRIPDWQPIQLIYDNPKSFYFMKGKALRKFESSVYKLELKKTTSTAFLTPTFIVLCTLIYIAMSLDTSKSTIQYFLQWGGNFGPHTTSGQIWRLFTCMFVHAGIGHFLGNMIIFYIIGRLVERVYGNLYFAIIYLGSGLLGAVSSMCVHPLTVSVGASGAIFGVFGALFSIYITRSASLVEAPLKRVLLGCATYMIFNAISANGNPMIDHAASPRRNGCWIFIRPIFRNQNDR